MDILISFVLAVSLLAISPGPDNVFVLMQSVIYGKKYVLEIIKNVNIKFMKLQIELMLLKRQYLS